jgi:hypothetical protein
MGSFIGILPVNATHGRLASFTAISSVSCCDAADIGKIKTNRIVVRPISPKLLYFMGAFIEIKTIMSKISNKIIPSANYT